MPKTVRSSIPVVLAVLIGGGLFYYAFRDVDVGELARSFRNLNLLWLPVLVSLPVLDLWLRALRWRILLRPVVDADVKLLFQLEAIGIAINNVLFLRVGELARAVVGGQELKVSTLSVLATLIVERICDLTALLILFTACALAMPELIERRIALYALAASIGAAASLAGITALGARVRGGGSLRWLRRWPRVEKLASDLIQGSLGLRPLSASLKVAALSVGLWLVDATICWFGGLAMGFSAADFGPLHGVVVVVTAAAASALPAVPGAFGNFEAAVRMLLEHFGFAKAVALGYAAVIHLIMYAVVTTLGLVFFYRLGHTFAGLKAAIQARGKS
ncbi:MAG: lysylphosphatidylglycerol synthase transmembrane domain-containing protein [Elusimicrobiota bacterium]